MNYMHTILQHFVLLIFIAFLSGCNTPVMHPWQLGGDDRWITIETGKWPVISQDLYVAVPEATIKSAEKLLHDKYYVELSPDQEAEFNHHLKRPATLNLKPYLICGVTMGIPFFTVVRRNLSTNEILVYRATWDGEISIPFMRPKFGIWPIVIYLETPPMRVYPTAVYGGDWIMRGQPERDTRLLDRKPEG